MIASNSPFYPTLVAEGSAKVFTFFSVLNGQPGATLGSTVNVNNTTASVIVGSSGIALLQFTPGSVGSQMVKVTITIGGVDVSNFLVETIEVDWPWNQGGTCRFSLTDVDPSAYAEAVVNVTATITDLVTGVSGTLQLFKGIVASYSYIPEPSRIEIQAQDMARSVSRESDKIDTVIFSVDPIKTDTVFCSTTDLLTLSSPPDTSFESPIIGIWNSTDTGRSNNLLTRMDYIVNGNTVSFIEAPTFDASGNQITFIAAGQTYIVTYEVPEIYLPPIQFVPKSTILLQIMQLAKIQNIDIQRTGFIEDETVGVNVVANKELPMDIMSKISLPQTWILEFDENGTLVVRREILKATPDWSYDESTILEDTLVIEKSLDAVINYQCVTGTPKSVLTGGNAISGPSSPSI